MRIAVIGSRGYTDYDQLSRTLLNLVGPNDVIVSGGAKGTDSMAKQFAEEHGLDFIVFKPYFMCDNSAAYTPKHFFVRNKQIIDNADSVIAFHDSVSKGTASAIKMASRAGKTVSVIHYTQEPI